MRKYENNKNPPDEPYCTLCNYMKFPIKIGHDDQYFVPIVN